MDTPLSESPSEACAERDLILLHVLTLIAAALPRNGGSPAELFAVALGVRDASWKLITHAFADLDMERAESDPPVSAQKVCRECSMRVQRGVADRARLQSGGRTRSVFTAAMAVDQPQKRRAREDALRILETVAMKHPGHGRSELIAACAELVIDMLHQAVDAEGNWLIPPTAWPPPDTAATPGQRCEQYL